MGRIAAPVTTVATAVAAAGAVLTVCPPGPGPAAADVVTAPAVYTLADGPLCGGTVNLRVDTGKNKPGRTDIQVVGVFIGISGTSTACRVSFTAHWHNLTTHRRGSFTDWVSGFWPAAPNRAAFSSQHTGAGRVQVWLEPHRPYLPGPTVTARAY